MKGSSLFSRLFMPCLMLAVALVSLAGVVRASGSSAGAPLAVPPDPLWGPDYRVNPPPDVKTDRHANLMFAIDPQNAQRVVGGYEYEDAGSVGSGFTASTDAGRTFNGRWFTETWGGPTANLAPAGQPTVDFDGHGVAYYASQAYSTTIHGWFVLTSTNLSDWSPAVGVGITDYTEARSRVQLVADKRAGGPNASSAYLVYRYYQGDYRGIYVTYSRDRAATWAPQVQVSDPANRYAFHPTGHVASDGTLYVGFEEYDQALQTSPHRLLLDRSTDGGLTWGTDHLITSAPISPTGAPDLKGRELVLLGNEFNGGFEVENRVMIATAPTDPNTVYAVWSDGRWDTTFLYYANEGRHGDIAFSKSTDAGVTWSAPMRVNDDPVANGVDQWIPAIAVQANGTIGVTWYDRRGTGFLYNLYYSQSTDGGATWSANRRVSDYSSDPMVTPNSKGIGELTDYNPLAYGPDYVLTGWVDSRRGTQTDVYTDRGILNTCTIAFTDVSTSDYFYDAVRYLSCRGAISGYADGTFRPYNNTTRGQVAKIIVLASSFDIDTAGGPHFSDVPADSPFYSYIETAYNRGIISGYSDGTFRPGNNVTRGQLSKMVVIARGWPINTTGGPHFSDVPTGSTFYTYIETAYHRGVISGYADGTFRPNNNATRGQISKIVYQAVVDRVP